MHLSSEEWLASSGGSTVSQNATRIGLVTRIDLLASAAIRNSDVHEERTEKERAGKGAPFLARLFSRALSGAPSYSSNRVTARTSGANDNAFPETLCACSAASSLCPSPKRAEQIHGPARGLRHQSASNRSTNVS